MLPAPMAAALLHYAASPVTPQPAGDGGGTGPGGARCPAARPVTSSFLAWAATPRCGRRSTTAAGTVFLEEDASWMASPRAAHPGSLDVGVGCLLMARLTRCCARWTDGRSRRRHSARWNIAIGAENYHTTMALLQYSMEHPKLKAKLNGS